MPEPLRPLAPLRMSADEVTYLSYLCAMVWVFVGLCTGVGSGWWVLSGVGVMVGAVGEGVVWGGWAWVL